MSKEVNTSAANKYISLSETEENGLVLNLTITSALTKGIQSAAKFRLDDDMNNAVVSAVANILETANVINGTPTESDTIEVNGQPYAISDYQVVPALTCLFVPRKVVLTTDWRAMNMRLPMRYDCQGEVLKPYEFKDAQQTLAEIVKRDSLPTTTALPYQKPVAASLLSNIYQSGSISGEVKEMPIALNGRFFKQSYFVNDAEDYVDELLRLIRVSLRDKDMPAVGPAKKD